MSNTKASVDVRRALLQQYLQREANAEPHAVPILHSGESSAPLSFGQRLIWLHSQSAPDLPLYTETWTVHFRAAIDPDALKNALKEFIRRHQAWRTVIRETDGEPVQVVLPAEEVEPLISDVRCFPVDERESRATELARADVREPFDLARGPLLRFRLISLAEDSHRLYVALHHSVFDGFAIYRIFLPELTLLYDCYCKGQTPKLPEPSITYCDYARWQHRRLQNGDLEQHLAYWRHRLAGELPTLNFPTCPRPPQQIFAGGVCAVAICRDLKERLKEFAGRQSSTLFMVLLASFYAVLYRYTGQQDLIVGTVTAGRNHPQLTELVGFCLNTVALRVDLSGEPTLADVVRRVRDATLDALEHDDVPFDEVVRALKVKPDSERHPIFQVMLTLEPPLKRTDERWDLTQVEVSTGLSKFDLYWELDEREDGISGKITYNSDLFSADAARELVDNFCIVLDAMTRDAQASLISLPLSSTLHSRPSSIALETTGRETQTDEQVTSADLEAQLRQIWRALLRNDAFGIHDSFFDLGGYSLLAVQMLSMVERNIGARISVLEFASAPTLAQLIRKIPSHIKQSRPAGSEGSQGEVKNAVQK